MATVPCPSCGLPRATDLLAAACPVCGSLGDEKPVEVEPEPLHDRPWVIAEPKPTPKRRAHGFECRRPLYHSSPVSWSHSPAFRRCRVFTIGYAIPERKLICFRRFRFARGIH